jgi:hypothetical protein
MPNYIPSTMGENMSNEASALDDKVSDGATQVKNKVSEMGRKAADQIDENLGAAANGLDRAAAGLHERADHLPGVERAEALAHGAADKLSATADYVRSHDVDRVLGDLKVLVAKHPGPSLLAAGVIGFWLGRTLIGNRS